MHLLYPDEANNEADPKEALRVAAFEQRRTETDIVRTAVRRYLGIED